MPAPRRSVGKPHPLFWITVAFLALVAVTGGSSRVDVPGLLVLRPVAMLACALAFLTLRRDQMIGRTWLFVGFSAMVVLILVHLIPLPPGVWQALPGRQEIAQSDALSGLVGPWRPLTLTPINAWQGLVSLAVPLAVLSLASQLDRTDLFRLVPLVIVIGAASGLFGLLQAIGSQSRLLDPYGTAADGGAGGLFANRNHAALLLAVLFPMLAAWVRTGSGQPRQYKMRVWGALALAAVLCPLILVTGSRTGLLLSLIGMAGAVAILVCGGVAGSILRTRRRTLAITAVTIVGLLVLGFVTFYFARAEAIIRLFDKSTIHDPRFDNWSVSKMLLMKYLPFGAGAGSFVEVYQIIEPSTQISPTYRNHAHNDILEIGITFGVAGLGLLLAGALAYLWRTVRLWISAYSDDRTTTIARMASIVLAMMVMASLTDYPLRTPTMMSVFALCCLWLLEPGRVRAGIDATGKVIP
ncbi:O-antigen ligase family protein [Sphingomonas sp. CFBP 8764]|uniref:O-antigen ligase family protein n=1 Tax=Sphingomonas sp. CFBP 8764 TaxID=2775275 RepID=UPI001780A3F2|nr:O-antigen ligase family protein [Sphingomonas sp. CFBP 8764]MBD8552707.1 O-antigen ligase family protein [Sphingomonas sp. CFBP 8764]